MKNRMPHCLLTVAMAWASMATGAVAAEDCGALKQVAAIDFTATPNGLPVIPVTMNGTNRQMLFSTAGGRSTLSQAAVDALGLHPVSGRGTLLDRAGNASQRTVTLASFKLGTMEATDLTFTVAPGGMNANIDGVFAGDLMENYDEDFDFSRNKLGLYAPDHCDGHVVYWTSAPASVVPFTRGRPGAMRGALTDTHIRFHVMLDGKDLHAVLATGAARSQMSAKVARYEYGVTEDSPNTVPLGAMDGKKVFGFLFKEMSFGDVKVTNAHVAILPDVMGDHDPNNSARAGTRIGRVDDDLEPDITIGMDVLKHLHVYVASKERKLYITGVAEPSAPAQAGRPPAAPQPGARE